MENIAVDGVLSTSYDIVEKGPQSPTVDIFAFQHLPPPPVEIFTGREDYLEQMKLYFEVENLQPNTGSQKCKVFVLYGYNGKEGKTQIALKFAELYRHCFAEILFINSSSLDILENKLANIVKEMEIGNTAREALQWLGSIARQRSWLLIFDDVGNNDEVYWNLRKYLPNAGNIIITTQNYDCRVHSQQKTTSVKYLPPKDAIDLLFKASILSQPYNHSSEQVELASELAEELRYEPLAIIQAGAYIRQNSNFSEYLQLFRNHRFAHYKDSDLSVWTTWDLAYKKLEHSARYLLKMCAFLHYERIPKVMFQRGVVGLLKEGCKIEGEYEGEHIIPLELVQWEDTLRTYWTTDNEFDTSKFNNAVSQLISYSFVHIGEGQNIYTIHFSLQLWIRYSLLKESERIAICMGMERFLCLSVTYKESTHELRQLLPHFLVLSDLQDIHDIPVGPEDDIRPEEALAAGFVYEKNDLWSKAEKKYVQALRARKRILGEKHPGTSTRQGKLIEIQELREQRLEASKRILGEEHPNTLRSMNNLASLYRSQGKWTEAQELQEQELELSKWILGEKHPGTLTSMNNLLFVYKSQGKWAKAQELQEQVLEGRKRILGEEHPDSLTSICELATIYEQQGKLTQAQELQEQALEARKRILGEEHPGTLTSISKLATVYLLQGKLTEAQELQEQAFEARMRILGEKHPRTLISMNNLALTYKSQGKLEKAQKLQEQEVELIRRVYGEGYPSTLTSMDNLSDIYKIQGKWVEAQDLLRHVLWRRERILGEDHPDTLTSMNNVALIEQALEDYPGTLTRDSLADINKVQGKWVKAQELQELELSKRILGEEQPAPPEAFRRLQ